MSLISFQSQHNKHADILTKVTIYAYNIYMRLMEVSYMGDARVKKTMINVTLALSVGLNAVFVATMIAYAKLLPKSRAATVFNLCCVGGVIAFAALSLLVARGAA